MTIIVEDGTVIASANSYVSVADADTYFENLGTTLWIETASDEAKEASLVRAASYMQQKYRLLWKGSRVQAFQSLDWPRRGVDVPDFFDPFFRQVNVPLQFQDTVFIGENVIPVEVQQAQMLLAISAIDAAGAATISLQPNYGRKTKREKVGDLEVEYMTAEDGGNTSQTETYWTATRIIEPYLRPSTPHTGTLVRA
ncbi:MAG: hypothetical protein OEQ39_12595 [Gammaproteobacteria bacterium]|nr:hypothetical protein [Gammaproteobacteria bacterium]